jgi:hypothetical protein
MKASLSFAVILLMVSLTFFSCIDRDTIAGTGKEVPERIISAGGNGQVGVVSSKLPIPVKVRIMAANGRPVRSIVVEFSVENSNAIFSDTTAVSDGNGYAQTTVTLGAKADSVRVYATVLGLIGSPVKFTFLSTSSAAANVALVSGNEQTTAVGNTFSQSVVVKVTDPFGNLTANVPVYFSTANGTFTPSSTISDSNGVASSRWKPDSLVGSKSAKVLVPSVQNGTINLTGKTISLTTAAVFQRISSDTFYTLQGTTIRNILVVKVKDKYGNPIFVNPPGAFNVNFSVVSGEGTVVPELSSTNIEGIAKADVSLGPQDSVMRIKASAGALVPPIYFTFFGYKSSQIDSLTSSAGSVTLYWQKNLNPLFAGYILQRCSNFNFDQTTVDVLTITDENVTSTTENGLTVGNEYFYRIKMNYSNGFYFYTNLRSVVIKP